MTAWDFASKVLDLIARPGLSDKVSGIILLAVVILIALQMMPIKTKPITAIARKVGSALNAEELERIEKLEHKSIKSEKDSVRMQMLILLSDYPQNTQEIMQVAYHYFKDIKGDWYMTTLFNNWLETRGIGLPEWFDRKA